MGFGGPQQDPYIPWGGSPPPRPPAVSSTDSPYAIKTKVAIDFPNDYFVDDGPRILDVDAVYIKLGTASTTTRITLENNGHHGKRVQDYWDTSNPPENSDATIYMVMDGTDYVMFTGVVARVTEWTREAVSFELASRAEKYRRLIGTTLNKTDYTNLPDENVGLIMPWIWGDVAEFKPILVNDDQVTELTQAMLTTDTTATVASTDGFSSSGTIRINDEKITYTGTTDTTFTGLTRGASSTEKGSHVAGNQVIEVGALEFLVCKHALNDGDITNISYVTDDGILVPVTPDSYTWSGPVIITFDEAPLLSVPSNTHKLKFIDADVDYGSTCTNPTYAIGMHADYTEYNYATIASGEYLQIKRDSGTPVVEPSGDIIRMWMVVEYHLGDTAYTDTEVFFNGNSKGTLPETTNTPDEVEADHGIHSMSAGFEDAHTHDMPDGDHYHNIGGDTTQITPNIDDVDGNVANWYLWGAFPDAYNGDWEDYEVIDLQLPTNKHDIKFPFCQVSEGVNLFRKIEKFRARFKLGREYSAGSSGTYSIYWVREWEGSDYHPWIEVQEDITVTLADGEAFGSLPKANLGEGGTTWDSGWKDFVDTYGPDDNVYAAEILNSYFMLEMNAACSDPFAVFNMEIDLVLSHEPENIYGDNDYFTYEPCGAFSSSKSKFGTTVDQDWSTHTEEQTTVVGDRWTFTSVSRPMNTPVLCIMPCITGLEKYNDLNTWRFALYKDGSPYSNAVTSIPTVKCEDGNYFAAQTSPAFFDLTGHGITAEDILQSRIFHDGVHAMECTVDVGCWVLYDDSGTGYTSSTDIGDTDEQEGGRSSLGWFDITDEGDYDGTWQYPVDKALKVVVGGSDNEVKVLRAFVAAEFAEREKRIIREIVCDVSGRANTWEDIIGDVITETDLIGMPAAYASVPALTGTGKGALLEQTDGWLFLERVVKEALCHGYWSWAGVYTVVERPAKGDLGDATQSITYSFKPPEISRRGIEKLVNKLEVFYNYNYRKGELADSLIEEDTTSQTKYNKTTEKTLALQLIRDAADAETWAEHTLSYMSECFDEWGFDVWLTGLSVYPSKLLSCDVDEFTCDKLEAKEVRIQGLADPNKMLNVLVKGVKYD